MANDRRRESRARFFVLAAGLCLSLPAGGCSLSFPLPGFVDGEATGSIGKRAVALSPDLDREDWRRADAALAVALDPQGNGADAPWTNPESGARGSFAALAPPFLEGDRICRKFRATLAVGAHPERLLAGSACRNRDGAWILADVRAEPRPQRAGGRRN